MKNWSSYLCILSTEKQANCMQKWWCVLVVSSSRSILTWEVQSPIKEVLFSFVIMVLMALTVMKILNLILMVKQGQTIHLN